MNLQRRNLPNLFRLSIITVVLTACGGGGGTGEATPVSGNGNDDKIATSLQKFGVDTTQTSRLDSNNDELPESYSPFGNTKTFNKVDELFFMGFDLDPSINSQLGIVKVVPQTIVNNETIYGAEPWFLTDKSTTPWALAATNQLRAAINADIDGDGIEEIIITYKQNAEDSVKLVVYSTKTNALTISEPLIISSTDVTDLGIAAGDFNGDGVTDVVVVESYVSSARLVFLENQSGSFVLTGDEIPLTASQTNSQLQIEMTVGNIDNDSADELAIVVNERFVNGTDEHGSHKYYIYDDSLTTFEQLNSGKLSSVVDLGAEGITGSGKRSALTASVSIGDVDADGVGEIVFSGLTGFDPALNCDYYYLTQVLDDARLGLVELSSHLQDAVPDSFTGNCNEMRLRHVHVNTLDYDNADSAEIQVNQFVYDDLSGSTPFLNVLNNEIDFDKLFVGVSRNISTPGVRCELTDFTCIPGSWKVKPVNEFVIIPFDYHNSAMDVGDVNKDNKEDIIFFSPATNNIHMWGNGNEFGVINTSLTNSNQQRPVILTANIDNDSLVLKYSGSDAQTDSAYKLVFTQPVIIAALAAPPCSVEFHQDVQGCSTSFGTSVVSNRTTEQSWNYSASASVGFSASFDIGVEIGQSAILTALTEESNSIASSYSLTKSVTYTSGGNQDGVIFTSIPYDQYTYTILSHPEPELIGKEIVVSLPRNPITILTTLDFYHAHIHPDGMKINSSVFSHTPGEIHTYPSESAKNQIAVSHGATNDFYESKVIDVGQGPFSTTASLNISKETSQTVSRGYEWSSDIETTAVSVVVGFSVGEGENNSLTISSGEESDYSGTVSNINSLNFSDTYSYGLFTYIHTPSTHPEMKFEVINYWVQ